jgi:xanthine phosphoribosyltransferase
MEFVETIALSWVDIARDAELLAAKLRPLKRRWKGIIAITRGGLIPAAMLARKLDIRMIDTACAVSYAGKQQGKVKMLKCPPGDGQGWLVVDDIADSGKTLKALRKHLPRAFFVTIYAKPVGKPLVDIHGVEIDQEAWLIFPWETGED